MICIFSSLSLLISSTFLSNILVYKVVSLIGCCLSWQIYQSRYLPTDTYLSIYLVIHFVFKPFLVSLYVVFSLSYWRTTILDSSANTKHSLAAASNPSQNKTMGEKILRYQIITEKDQNWDKRGECGNFDTFWRCDTITEIV